MPLSDVRPAVRAIVEKQKTYPILWDYYEGDQEIKYSTQKLQKVFATFGVYFAENWSQVVVDASVDRINLTGFSVTDDVTGSDILMAFFSAQLLALVSNDVHLAAGVTGEAFYILDQNEGNLSGYFNDPELCIVFYDSDNPSQKHHAAKMWEDEKTVHVTLYYPHSTERWIAQKRKSKELATLVYEEDPDRPVTDNPSGIIPVFHFRGSQQGRTKIDLGKSERSIQDAINILFANMMVSAEFSSLRQRIIISQADPGDLKNIPGENWWIPQGDGTVPAPSVTELGGYDPTPFLTAIDKLANAMAATTRTPKHFFYSTNEVPSGESLLTMEAPLNKKTLKRRSNYEVTWIELAELLLILSNHKVDRSKIGALWEAVESVQPLTQAQVHQTNVSATMPLVTSLRRSGWSQSEIEQMEKDKKKEKSELSGLAQAELDRLRAQDAQDNTDLDNTSDTEPTDA